MSEAQQQTSHHDAMPRARAAVIDLVEKSWFRRSIIALIVCNALILGLETYPWMLERHGAALHAINTAIVAVFVIELVLRLYAYRWSFFRDGWNIFDFVVVVAALIPAGTTSAALRLLRLLRVFRLLSTVRSMRLVVNALMGSIPGILSMGALFAMVLYVFAVASTTLIAPLDPQHYGDLGKTLTSLYRVVMGDGWGDVIVPVASEHPWLWVYFIAFSFIGAVILLNLFVAVVVESMNRMQTAELELVHEEEQDLSQQILDEIRELREEVARMGRGEDRGAQ